MEGGIAVTPKTAPRDPATTKSVQLGKEHELRFEADFDTNVVVRLLEGTAECFGTELVQLREYVFRKGTKSAIFSWHGCTLEGQTKREKSSILIFFQISILVFIRIKAPC
jgi:hypothetical protein